MPQAIQDNLARWVEDNVDALVRAFTSEDDAVVVAADGGNVVDDGEHGTGDGDDDAGDDDGDVGDGDSDASDASEGDLEDAVSDMFD